MGRDPAFLFYPNDYIGGTMGMTFEEKGAYMEVLMMQFNRGHMTSHMIGQTIGQLWVNVKDKFAIDEDGLYYNERLELEQAKRKAFTDSRKNNIKGTNQHTKKDGHLDGHMTSHMEDRNRNKDLKHKHGEYEHILLTDKQYEKLTADLGKDFTTYMIKKVDEGIQMKGYKYKDHNLVIRNWAKKETPPKQQKEFNSDDYYKSKGIKV